MYTKKQLRMMTPADKFVQAANDAIFFHHVTFPLYRMVNGKVETFTITSLENDYGVIKLFYKNNEQKTVKEKATETDLRLISQQAKKLSSQRK